MGGWEPGALLPHLGVQHAVKSGHTSGMTRCYGREVIEGDSGGREGNKDRKGVEGGGER